MQVQQVDMDLNITKGMFRLAMEVFERTITQKLLVVAFISTWVFTVKTLFSKENLTLSKNLFITNAFLNNTHIMFDKEKTLLIVTFKQFR